MNNYNINVEHTYFKFGPFDYSLSYDIETGEPWLIDNMDTAAKAFNYKDPNISLLEAYAWLWHNCMSLTFQEFLIKAGARVPWTTYVAWAWLRIKQLW